MAKQHNPLAKQPSGAEDAAIEPMPEEFGFPEKPTVAQLRCWRNQERFLEEFARCGIISHAAKAAGVSVPAVEAWDGRDMYGFKKRKTWSAKVALGVLEAEIQRRGVEGYDEPLHHKGVLTGDVVRRFSDNLLMFRVKRIDPAYRDNYQVPVSDNRQVHITYNLHPDADLSRLPSKADFQPAPPAHQPE